MENKFNEIVNAVKINELFRKKEAEENKKNVVLTILAIIGIVTVIAGIAAGVYKYFASKEDYYDDFDFDDDMFEDEDEA